MATGYNVSIGLTDNITKPLEVLNKRLASISAPVQRFGKALDKFKDLSGLTFVTNGFRRIGDFAGNALRTVTSMVPVLSALTGGAIIAGVAKLTSEWAKFGTHLLQTSALLGTTVPKLQTLENAFRLAGGSASDADENIRGLSDSMQAALSNKSPEAATFFSQLGIDIADGVFKAKSGAEQLETVMQKIKALHDTGKLSDSSLRDIGHGLGLNDKAVSIAVSDNFDEYLKRSKSMGGMSEGDAKNAREFASSISAVGIAFENMGNTILSTVAPHFTPLLDQFQQFLTTNQGLVRDKVGAWAKDFADYIKTIDFKQVMDGCMQFATKVENIVTSLGGVMRVSEAIIGLWVGAKFAAMVANIASVVSLLSSPAMLAIMALAGGTAAAYSLGTKQASDAEMARQLGYTASSVDDMGHVTAYRDKAGKTVLPEELPKNYQAAGGSDAQIKSKPELDAAAKKAFDWWVSNGASPEAASGLVAQEEAESGFRPGAIGDDGDARGSFQWHSDRRDKILKGSGIDVWKDTDFESQHRAALWELQHSEKPAGDAVFAAKTPEEGGGRGSRLWERPGLHESDRAREERNRAGLARQRYDQFANQPRSAAPQSTGINPPAGGGAKVSGGVDVNVKFANSPAGMTADTRSSGQANAPAPLVMFPMKSGIGL